MRLITWTYLSQGHIYTNILMECQLTFSLRKKLLQHDLLCIYILLASGEDQTFKDIVVLL